MTPCVGWRGENPCPVYGHEHGCKHPDRHSVPRWHECPCGARARAWTARIGDLRCQPIYRLTDHREAT